MRPLSDLDVAEDLRMPDDARRQPWQLIVESMALTANLLADYGLRAPGDIRAVREYARIARSVADSLDRYVKEHS